MLVVPDGFYCALVFIFYDHTAAHQEMNMDWTIEFIEEYDFVTIETEGYFSNDDSCMLLRDLIYQEYWKPELKVFFDHRNRDYQTTESAQIEKLNIDFIKDEVFIYCNKIAILLKANCDPERDREINSLTKVEGFPPVRMFRNADDALRWIKG